MFTLTLFQAIPINSLAVPSPSLRIYQYNNESQLWKEVTYPNFNFLNMSVNQTHLCIKATSTISGYFCWWKDLTYPNGCVSGSLYPLYGSWKHRKTATRNMLILALALLCIQCLEVYFRLGGQLGYAFPAIWHRKYHIWRRAILFSVNILLTYNNMNHWTYLDSPK